MTRSRLDQEDVVGRGAQAAESGHHVQATDSAQPDGTRYSAVKAIVADGDLCERVGSAWRLFLRLILIEEGTMIGTHEQIGEKMGVGANTARNWVNGLAGASLITKAVKGRTVEVRLAEPYASMAALPEVIVPTTPSSTVTINDTPRMALLRTVEEAATKAGTTIEIRLVV